MYKPGRPPSIKNLVCGGVPLTHAKHPENKALEKVLIGQNILEQNSMIPIQ
jgi:hypothetical protein